MLAADLQDTAYSVLPPPKTTATRTVRVDRTSEASRMSETPAGERPPVGVTHSATSHTQDIYQGHRKHGRYGTGAIQVPPPDLGRKIPNVRTELCTRADDLSLTDGIAGETLLIGGAKAAE
jgi:hypothetical protein